MSRQYTYFAACLCILLMGAAGSARHATAGDATLENTKSVLEALIQRELGYGLPSASVSLIQDGKVVWSAAYGYANVRMKVPATPETIYRTASTIKPFTATAILTLVDQGKCSLDDPVNQYLGENKIRDNPENSVTIRHILDHTSGLKAAGDRNVSGGISWKPWHREAPKSLEYVAALLESGSPAGKEYQYNNFAYGLAGLLIEKISGVSFEAYILEHILIPLGVTTPHPVYPSAEMLEMMALPYEIDPEGNPTPFTMEQSAAYPAGDLYFTAEDMDLAIRAYAQRARRFGDIESQTTM